MSTGKSWRFYQSLQQLLEAVGFGQSGDGYTMSYKGNYYSYKYSDLQKFTVDTLVDELIAKGIITDYFNAPDSRGSTTSFGPDIIP